MFFAAFMHTHALQLVVLLLSIFPTKSSVGSDLCALLDGMIHFYSYELQSEFNCSLMLLDV